MTADPSPGGGPCRRAAALRPPLRAFVLPALAVLLAGCVAETVRKNPPRKGPVQTVGYIDLGGGEVRYSTDGWSWFVAGRRHAAVHLMHRVCGRFRPVVTEEFTKEDADVPYSQEDITVTIPLGAEHFTVAPYTHLVFECAESSTAPVRAQPLRGLPPPPRPAAPAISASAAAIPVVVPVVTVSSAPAALAPAPLPAAPPPAAAWIAFPAAWTPVPAPPKIQTSSAAPSATPSEVKHP